MVNLIIDNRPVSVPERTTILNAAASVGIHIPTLCFLKDINEIAACRVCVVEVEGYERLLTACNNPVAEGMVIHTDSHKARIARKANVELILSQHKMNCPVCVRSGNCKLQRVANDLNVHDIPFETQLTGRRSDIHFPLIREYDKCIKCMRCVQVCDKIQDSHIWDVINMGAQTTVAVGEGEVRHLKDSSCTLCGQCITHCPTGALRERDDTDKIFAALEDPDKIVVAQIAPAVRTSWGEAFHMKAEEATMKRLTCALKTIGFDYVFDTDFSADLTIMEEASEFLEKVKRGDQEKFPMFTSCCPGWLRYCKAQFPEFVDQLSTSKSPQQMFGAVIKTYFAEKIDVDPARIYSVSIMPCLAKKAECGYETMKNENGEPDVDVVLTTREVDRLLRMMNLEPAELPEVELDHPFPLGSGAGNIFGATGGVMEAALRTAYQAVTGHNPDPDAFSAVRGMEGWKEETFDLAGTPLKVAVVHGLANAGRLLHALKEGKVHYDFVEVMACPGGCVGGGGQPIYDGCEMAALRAPTLYTQDRAGALRFCHENPEIQNCYRDFLEKPLSEKAEKLLHTDQHGWKMPLEI